MWALQSAWELISDIGLRDVIDIAVVATLIYYLTRMVRRTRAISLINGVVVVLVVILISTGLPTLNWLLRNLIVGGALALVVIFQPELRMGLERLGRGGIFSAALGRIGGQRRQFVINEVVDAAYRLAEDGYGGLIVLERRTGLMDIIRTGKVINSDVSVELLLTIFHPGTPLHDGAIVLRDDKIVAAACALPHSESPGLSTSTGMRHRAALGLAERTDAVCVVISEETGAISLAVNATLSPRVARPQLTERLMELFEAEQGQPSFFFWRK